jgi:hypothetical protein
MAELENKLTWSHSRQNTFNACKRKYYYQHYGSWGGWDVGAPREIRQAYCLKNIDGIDAYLGNLVHKHISEICVDVSKSRTYDENLTVAVERELDQAFAQSLKTTTAMDSPQMKGKPRERRRLGASRHSSDASSLPIWRGMRIRFNGCG